MISSLRGLIKSLNIPDSRIQCFNNILFNYLKFQPSQRLSNRKINLTEEESKWISSMIPNDSKLRELSKEFSIQKSLEKYGVDSPNRYPPKIDKAKHTLLTSEIGNNREKYFETCKLKYGVHSVNSLETKIQEAKETCRKKYGGNSSACAGSEIRKIQTIHGIATKLKKYGRICTNIKFVYKDVYFQSKLEFYFYIYHTEIMHEDVKRGPILEYTCDNKQHKYECDFEINGRLFEIKGNHFLSKDKKRLIFPYIKQTKVDIQHAQNIYDAKMLCMHRNNVTILSYSELANEIEYGKKRFQELSKNNQIIIKGKQRKINTIDEEDI